MFLERDSLPNIEYNLEPSIESEIIILLISLDKAPSNEPLVSYISRLFRSFSRPFRSFSDKKRLTALYWWVEADIYTIKNQDFKMCFRTSPTNKTESFVKMSRKSIFKNMLTNKSCIV